MGMTCMLNCRILRQLLFLCPWQRPHKDGKGTGGLSIVGISCQNGQFPSAVPPAFHSTTCREEMQQTAVSFCLTYAYGQARQRHARSQEIQSPQPKIRPIQTPNTSGEPHREPEVPVILILSAHKTKCACFCPKENITCPV